jgi:hypothetical protein
MTEAYHSRGFGMLYSTCRQPLSPLQPFLPSGLENAYMDVGRQRNGHAHAALE